MSAALPEDPREKVRRRMQCHHRSAAPGDAACPECGSPPPPAGWAARPLPGTDDPEGDDMADLLEGLRRAVQLATDGTAHPVHPVAPAGRTRRHPAEVTHARLDRHIETVRADLIDGRPTITHDELATLRAAQAVLVKLARI